MKPNLKLLALTVALLIASNAQAQTRCGDRPGIPIAGGVGLLLAGSFSVAYGVAIATDIDHPSYGGHGDEGIVAMAAVSVPLIGGAVTCFAYAASVINCRHRAEPEEAAGPVERYNLDYIVIVEEMLRGPVESSNLEALYVSRERRSEVRAHWDADAPVLREVFSELVSRISEMYELPSRFDQRARARQILEWLGNELEGRVDDTTLQLLFDTVRRQYDSSGIYSDPSASVPRDDGIDLSTGSNPVFVSGRGVGIRF